MMVKALITEQLDSNGALKTLQMKPGQEEHMVVAFAHEYDEPKDGPFHFLHPDDERRYKKGFADCRARVLSKDNFWKSGDVFHVKSLRWSGIPTQAQFLSYYALSLPQFAVPRRLSIFDPQRRNQYRRTVKRDDDRHRYVIYLECESSIGRFDFELDCDFVIDEVGFGASEYKDPQTNEYGRRDDEWRHFVGDKQVEEIRNFFAEAVPVRKSNPWISGSFYLVALLIIMAFLLVVGRVVSVVVIPFVIIGGVVAVAIVGALQLRNDSRLSQKNFIELMALSFRQLPFIGSKK